MCYFTKKKTKWIGFFVSIEKLISWKHIRCIYFIYLLFIFCTSKKAKDVMTTNWTKTSMRFIINRGIFYRYTLIYFYCFVLCYPFWFVTIPFVHFFCQSLVCVFVLLLSFLCTYKIFLYSRNRILCSRG